MSDESQSNTGGLWDEHSKLPTLTPLDTDRRAAAAATQAARVANQVAVQEQIRALTRARSAAEHGPSDGDQDTVRVRIQWAETVRYEADVYVDPWASEASILAGLADLSASQRRVLTAVESDNRLVSVIDLDGDGHIDTYELSTSAAQVDDWDTVADAIDEGLAASPSWPRLKAALHSAADDGWDVAEWLPTLAAAAPLPDHDPAGELYYRLLNSGIGKVSTDDGTSGDQHLMRHDEPPTYASDAPHPAAPGL